MAETATDAVVTATVTKFSATGAAMRAPTTARADVGEGGADGAATGAATWLAIAAEAASDVPGPASAAAAAGATTVT